MKPTNGDGFVNWLTTHLINALGHAAGHADAGTDRRPRRPRDLPRRRRPLVPARSGPRRARTTSVFFVRMNNSTRELPEGERERYIVDHWPTPTSA